MAGFDFSQFTPEMTLQDFFAAMQGGMPQPTAYQAPTQTFEQLMSAFGNWNPTAQAPGFPAPNQPANPTMEQQPAPEGGTSPGYGPTPSWPGPFGQTPIPTAPGGSDPSQWAYWAQDQTALQPLQNWASFMSPYLANMQNAFQYNQDFGESSRRYDQDSEWSRYADQFAMDINARQQQAYEAQQALTAQQWLSEFEKTNQNDQFSQQMALQNQLMSMARLANDQRTANLQAYGRGGAPGRFSASWG